jgi:hypothetical protein
MRMNAGASPPCVWAIGLGLMCWCSLIQAGNIYVWEERGAQVDSTGLSMERW